MSVLQFYGKCLEERDFCLFFIFFIKKATRGLECCGKFFFYIQLTCFRMLHTYFRCKVVFLFVCFFLAHFAYSGIKCTFHFFFCWQFHFWPQTNSMKPNAENPTILDVIHGDVAGEDTTQTTILKRENHKWSHRWFRRETAGFLNLTSAGPSYYMAKREELDFIIFFLWPVNSHGKSPHNPQSVFKWILTLNSVIISKATRYTYATYTTFYIKNSRRKICAETLWDCR